MGVFYTKLSTFLKEDELQVDFIPVKVFTAVKLPISRGNKLYILMGSAEDGFSIVERYLCDCFLDVTTEHADDFQIFCRDIILVVSDEDLSEDEYVSKEDIEAGRQ